jgi:hypothetical protein
MHAVPSIHAAIYSEATHNITCARSVHSSTIYSQKQVSPADHSTACYTGATVTLLTRLYTANCSTGCDAGVSGSQ